MMYVGVQGVHIRMVIHKGGVGFLHGFRSALLLSAKVPVKPLQTQQCKGWHRGSQCIVKSCRSPTAESVSSRQRVIGTLGACLLIV